MLSNTIKFLLAAVITISLLGCSQNNMIKVESKLDKNWGRSFESARHNQILNPDAGKSDDPVVGMQGPAAKRVMDSYVSGKDGEAPSSPEFGVVTIKK